MERDAIAVVDFGGQYAHLIATKIRRLGVLAEIRQPEDPVDAFRAYKGIILSGSPSLSSRGEDSDYTTAIYDLDIPILGFCFGHQEIAKRYGGSVVHGGREWGRAALHLTGAHPLFDGLGPVEHVWMSHYDSVTSIGPEFRELGYTYPADGVPAHRYAAIGSDTLRRYGFQFHPEVDDTEHGDRMIANFVFGVCGCRSSWSMAQYLEEQVAHIRARVGEESVFMLVSGGVDSTVAAMLLRRALGPERLRLLHIDNGLLRKNEVEEVRGLLAELDLDRQLLCVDASERFLAALDGVTEPEQKRRVIGDAFVEVFEEVARREGIERHLLGQGTIYPDTIETGGTKRADTIKTHHNRVPVIAELMARGRVIEPLAELYKVEVRELGKQLGVPERVLRRHPFPGPGLAVRLVCATGDEVCSVSDDADRLLRQIAGRYRLEAQLLPIRSVGVKADLRVYEQPVLLAGDASWETLTEATSLITAQVPGVNRCIWYVGGAPPRGAKVLARGMERRRLAVLREADHIVTRTLERQGVYDEIWQCPTVLVPLNIDGRGGELVVVRPVKSQRAMTARPAELPAAVMQALRREILELPGVAGLALDVTSKPPATIEWE